MSGSEEARFEAGMRVRRQVLGDAHVDQAIARTDAFTEPFQAFITRTAWADIWDRPGLDRRERSIVTLAALTALRADGEIAMHVRAAIRNGVTREEIAEILLHVSVYAGLPAGNAAFAIAQQTLEEQERTAESGER
jgi:4-carboxymuconolactone decarboxylase